MLVEVDRVEVVMLVGFGPSHIFMPVRYTIDSNNQIATITLTTT